MKHKFQNPITKLKKIVNTDGSITFKKVEVMPADKYGKDVKFKTFRRRWAKKSMRDA